MHTQPQRILSIVLWLLSWVRSLCRPSWPTKETRFGFLKVNPPWLPMSSFFSYSNIAVACVLKARQHRLKCPDVEATMRSRDFSFLHDEFLWARKEEWYLRAIVTTRKLLITVNLKKTQDHGLKSPWPLSSLTKKDCIIPFLQDNYPQDKAISRWLFSI